MKRAIAALAVVSSLFISPISQAEQHYYVPIHALHVITGRDLGIPDVTLKWGDSVTYELDATARLLFKFRTALQAITMVGSSGNPLNDVILSGNNSQLTITIKDNTAPWTAKATFFFLPLGLELPAAGGLDPTIGNGGGPRQN